jgi:RNase adaptor protein for sRNA GlmZ degradation
MVYSLTPNQHTEVKLYTMEGLASMILTYLNQHTEVKLYTMEGLASMILKYLNQHTGVKLYTMEPSMVYSLIPVC